MGRRTYPRRRIVRGTYKRQCDRCGWDYLRTELFREWNGKITCRRIDCFDPRHEREFPRRIPPERVAVPDSSGEEQPQFSIYLIKKLAGGFIKIKNGRPGRLLVQKKTLLS